ncbi:Tripartite motif-containing protein 3 [Hypsibius exemplaris]|uniref:Tripartite motif-containing protein 3 n=1 Tax=Hypsibius exemplaris TaxID=2072580 RepID=A0A1W0WDP3_HYPEX|nr:Tripartite motif-containing protein 3 [Hypsibius exemplaris]
MTECSLDCGAADTKPGLPETCLKSSLPETCLKSSLPKTCLKSGLPETCLTSGLPETCLTSGLPETCLELGSSSCLKPGGSSCHDCNRPISKDCARQHENEDPPSLILCEGCSVVICSSCSLKPFHHDHALKSFIDARQEIKMKIRELLLSASAKITDIEAALQTSSPSPSHIPVFAGSALRRTISHTPTSRNVPATANSQRLERETSLKSSKARLEKVCLEIESLLQDDTPESVLKLKRLLTAKLLHEQTTPSSSVMHRQPAQFVPKFSRSISTGTNAANTGDTRDVVCAITSGLAKDGTVAAVPGKDVKLRLLLWSRDVRSRPPSAESLSFSLEKIGSENGEESIPPKLQQRQIRTDTFEVTLRMAKESIFRLHILLAGAPVNGSPYTVVVRSQPVREEVIRESLFSPCSSVMSGGWKGGGRPGSPRSGSVSALGGSVKRQINKVNGDMDEDDLLVMRIGSAGREAGCFLNPQDICIVDEKMVAVTDSNIGCIQLFSIDGIFLKRFGQRGRKLGQIIRPTGIAFLPKCQNRWQKDILVVADYENRTVILFSLDGECLTSFGAARLTGPKGVAVALNGDIIVADNRSNSLFVFRSCKMFKKVWSPSSTTAHLAGPHYVAVARDTGDILVSDFHHHTIKVFDSDYNYRWSFGSFNAEAGMGSFSGPTGIVSDQRGIAVADWGSGRIQLFDHSGSFLAYVTTLANPLYGPQGLAIAQDGTIFACDSGNHTVRVYRHPLA